VVQVHLARHVQQTQLLHAHQEFAHQVRASAMVHVHLHLKLVKQLVKPVMLEFAHYAKLETIY